MLAKEKCGSSVLDVVIDSGGAEIMAQTRKILKNGGRVVCYGMCVPCNLNLRRQFADDLSSRTASPKITFTMREVLKNQQLIGTSSCEHLISTGP